jgi:hypothetical protein
VSGLYLDAAVVRAAERNRRKSPEASQVRASPVPLRVQSRDGSDGCGGLNGTRVRASAPAPQDARRAQRLQWIRAARPCRSAHDPELATKYARSGVQGHARVGSAVTSLSISRDSLDVGMALPAVGMPLLPLLTSYRSQQRSSPPSVRLLEPSGRTVRARSRTRSLYYAGHPCRAIYWVSF